MRRARGVLLGTTTLFLIGACGGGSSRPAAAPPPSPTPTTVAMVASAATPGYTPLEDREPAPRVVLSNGEEVDLFESFDHGNFTDSAVIDNPWLPMEPGTRHVYEGFTAEDGEVIPHRVVSTVTDLVKIIDGVPSVVIWDVDYSDGDLVETELAFFAQDDDGNVWRMGEYPEEWEEGEFIDAPTWIAGIGDARAGIAMKADPELGAPSYSQGWGPDVGFTDRAFVFEMGLAGCVAVDCFEDVLVIDEFNEEEPGAHQLKYYAQGIGNVQVGWRGDDSSIEELELVEVLRLTTEELEEVRQAALTLEERAHILREEVFGPTERAEVPGLG